MHIFALETDIEKIKQRYVTPGEQEIMTVYHHGLSFFFALIRQSIFTIVITAAGIGAVVAGVAIWTATILLFFIWFFLVFNNIIRAYLDWNHDFIFITTDKVVLYDQSSFFHHVVTPINMENFASVSSSTQCFNIFNFGVVEFNLKEGTGEKIRLKYIPNANEVAAAISQCITQFQRRHPAQNSGA